MASSTNASLCRRIEKLERHCRWLCRCAATLGLLLIVAIAGAAAASTSAPEWVSASKGFKLVREDGTASMTLSHDALGPRLRMLDQAMVTRVELGYCPPVEGSGKGIRDSAFLALSDGQRVDHVFLRHATDYRGTVIAVQEPRSDWETSRVTSLIAGINQDGFVTE